MAYYQQKIMSAQPGTTTDTDHENPQIRIVNGIIAPSFINKAVTYDGDPTDLSCPAVKLAGENEVVIGALIGVAYGKLQVVVEGWDIKFLAAVGGMTQNTRIVGGAALNVPGVTDGTPGYVNHVAPPGNTYLGAAAQQIYAGRGNILQGGAAAGDRVYVSLKLGG